jgi:DNA-binding NarL/FixJ family response regulator
MIRIAVCDDHSLLREGLVNILSSSGKISVEAQAGTVAEAKQMLDRHPEVSILLCDINLPDGDGYEVLKYVKTYNKAVKVVFLSMHDKSCFATRAMEAGAAGYLTKDAQKDELLTALLAVADGRKYIGQQIMINLVENMNKSNEGSDFFQKRLSKRELEVLELIVAGFDTKEIAEKLFISEKTAANYRIAIMQKCGVKNIVQLIKLYLETA